MRTVSVTAEGTAGASNWVLLDRYPEDMDVGLSVSALTSGAAASVQFTLTDVSRPGAAPITHVVTALSAVSSIAYAPLPGPAAAVRVVLTSVGSAAAAAAATLEVIQAGS